MSFVSWSVDSHSSQVGVARHLEELFRQALGDRNLVGRRVVWVGDIPLAVRRAARFLRDQVLLEARRRE